MISWAKRRRMRQGGMDGCLNVTFRKAGNPPMSVSGGGAWLCLAAVIVT